MFFIERDSLFHKYFKYLKVIYSTGNSFNYFANCSETTNINFNVNVEYEIDYYINYFNDGTTYFDKHGFLIRSRKAISQFDETMMRILFYN